MDLYFAWTFGLLIVLTAACAPLLRGRYGFLLGALLYASVDFLDSRVGLWTLFGALTWGLVGYVFTRWNVGAQPKWTSFIGLSFAGTIIFDTITGPLLSPLVWGMSFWEALVGQIPFTLSHLIGNLVLTALFSPILFADFFLNESVKKLFLRAGAYEPAKVALQTQTKTS